MPHGATGGVLAWLLTYALHSTVLLGLAALLTRRHVRAETWRDALWKAALVGGIVTTSVQQIALTRIEPLGGVMSMSNPVTPEAGEFTDERSQSIEPAVPSPVSSPPRVFQSASDDAGTLQDESAAAWRPARAQLIVGAWLVGALALLGRLARHHVRLFRALRGRVELRDGAAAATLASLRRSGGVWWPVRLSVAPCPTPIALGAAEICVPQRFVNELDAHAQQCALAHELGHLARRDPIWHFAAGVIESVFFFQPLNRLARVRLRDAAEHLADDWAVRHTGSALGLARCLSEVATWVDAGAVMVPKGTMAMAEAGSPLIRRIERLLVDSMVRHEPSLARRMLVAVGVLTLAGVTMPAVTARALPIRVASTPPSSAAHESNTNTSTSTDTHTSSNSNSSTITPSVSTSSSQESLLFDGADPADEFIYQDAIDGGTLVCELHTERIEIRGGEWLGVKSRVGRVRIAGWDRSHAEVTVRECAGTREQLLAAHMQILHKDGGYRIESRFAAGTNLSWNIDEPASPSNPSVFDYTIRVPRGTELRHIDAAGGPLTIQNIDGAVSATAAEGPISAIDLRGSVQLQSSSGAVQLTLMESPGGDVALESALGSVTLWVDAGADATIRARSGSGQVRGDMRLEGTEWHRATLGRGGNVITLASQQGSVDVRLDGRGDDGSWQEERIPLTSALRARAQANVRAYGEDALVRTLARISTRVPKHEADLVAERAIWALAQMRAGDVLTPLMTAAQDDDWRVRAYAAWNLSELAPARTRELLTELAADEHWRVRMTAAYGLGATGDLRTLNALEALLGDDHWQVRVAGVDNLAAIGDRRAVPALKQLLDDPHTIVREAARAAVARLSSIPIS